MRSAIAASLTAGALTTLVGSAGVTFAGTGAVPSWNALVAIDAGAGELVVFDASGAETARVAHGLASTYDYRVVATSGDNALLGSAEAVGGAPSAIVSTDDAVVTPIAVGETFEYVRQIVPSPVVAMGGGGPPTLVHLGFAQSIDLTTVGLPAGTGFDGEEAMASPSGTVAAISGADGSTVIVTFAAGTPPVAVVVPGRVGAVTEDFVAVFAPDTSVQYVTAAGEVTATGQPPGADDSFALTGGVLGFLGADGTLSSLTPGEPSFVDRGVQFDFQTVLGAESYASGAGFLVYEEGVGIHLFTSAFEAVGVVPSITPSVVVEYDDVCFVAANLVVDSRSGAVTTAGGSGEAASRSLNGCTVAFDGDASDEVVRNGAVIPIDGDARALSPDGATAVVETGERIMLVDLDGGTVVDVADAGPLDGYGFLTAP